MQPVGRFPTFPPCRRLIAHRFPKICDMLACAPATAHTQTFLCAYHFRLHFIPLHASEPVGELAAVGCRRCVLLVKPCKAAGLQRVANPINSKPPLPRELGLHVLA